MRQSSFPGMNRGLLAWVAEFTEDWLGKHPHYDFDQLVYDGVEAFPPEYETDEETLARADKRKKFVDSLHHFDVRKRVGIPPSVRERRAARTVSHPGGRLAGITQLALPFDDWVEVQAGRYARSRQDIASIERDVERYVKNHPELKLSATQVMAMIIQHAS